MNENIQELTRRVEILASCMNGTKLSKGDYADLFNVKEITINRDLSALKSLGIQIYSKKGKVVLLEKPGTEVLIYLSANYLPVMLNSDFFHEKVKLFAKTGSENYFQLLTFISKAVKGSLVLEINYLPLDREEPSWYRLKPVRLSYSGYNWILDAYKCENDKLRTFYLSRIKEIKNPEKTFSEVSLSEKEVQCHEIVLRFDKEVEREVHEKIWFDKYEITTEESGSLLLKTTQPVTNHLASWCISWWDALEIVQPVELKNHVKNMWKHFSDKNRI